MPIFTPRLVPRRCVALRVWSSLRALVGKINRPTFRRRYETPELTNFAEAGYRARQRHEARLSFLDRAADILLEAHNAHLQLSRLCRLRTSPRLQTGLTSSQADFTMKRLAVLQTWRLGRRKQVHVSGATLGAGDASCAVPTQWTADVHVDRGQGCAVMSLHCF